MTPEDVAALRNYCVSVVRRNDPANAEDHAQDAMVHALSNLHQFQPETGVRGLKAWLARITVNAAIENYRRAQVQARKTERLKWAIKQEGASPVITTALPRGPDSIELSETIAAIARLHPDRRAMILAGVTRSYEELAEELGVSPTTVRTRLYRARQELRGLMADGE